MKELLGFDARLFCIGLAVTAFLCGAASMQVLLSVRLARTRGFSLQPDLRPKVCTVTLEGIRDAFIEGTLTGSGRVFIGDTQALPRDDGSFSVPAGPFLTRRVTVTVPQGAQFVASKRGSKYYPLRSMSAEKIAPQNRVYFQSHAQAREAGFHP